MDYGDEHNADLLLSIIDEHIPRNIKLINFEQKKEYIDNNINKLTEYANNKKNEYRQYLLQQGIEQNKHIAIVDTGAATFSAQQIVETVLNKKIMGIYSIITNPQYAENKNINYKVWSKDKDVIKNITSIIEFCFSAPELPIIDLINGKPVYIKNPNINELYRNSLCSIIINGILDFVQDFRNVIMEYNISFSNKETNEYIYYFIKYLSLLDKKKLKKVNSPSNSSHTEYKQNLLIDMQNSIHNSYAVFDKIFSLHKEYVNNNKRIIIRFFGIKLTFKF